MGLEVERSADSPGMRLDVERLGTLLVVLATIIVLASVGLSASLRLAVDDMHAIGAIMRAENPPPSRSPLGEWLSATLASDVLPPANATALNARMLELDHRADRLLELAGVVALVGLLLALLTGRPAREVAQACDASRPLASTSSNGTV
jgi:hypothetical protein